MVDSALNLVKVNIDTSKGIDIEELDSVTKIYYYNIQAVTKLR